MTHYFLDLHDVQFIYIRNIAITRGEERNIKTGSIDSNKFHEITKLLLNEFKSSLFVCLPASLSVNFVQQTLVGVCANPVL